MMHIARSPNNSHSSAVDFDDQIKQLELEGNRLLAAANSLSDSLSTSKFRKTTPVKVKSDCLTATAFSSLVDISAEQRTIEEIRAQLDSQSREAELFSQRLLGSKVPSSLGYRYPSTGSLLDKLELPVVTSFSNEQQACGSSRNQHHIYATEQKLRESQNEILDLRTKLEEVVTISEKQKEHFRTTVEELRQQLLATNTSKDAVLRAKEIEFTEQESCVSKLRRQVEQLEMSNKCQERTILEMNEKLEVQQRERRLVESSLNQIRGQLLDQERKRGVLFCCGLNAPTQVSVLDQDIAALVRSIDRCIQELDMDVEVKKEKLKELTFELSTTKDQFAAKEQDLKKQHEVQMSELILRHQTETLNANDSCSSANKRVVSLEEQLAKLREDYECLIRNQTMSVEETEQRLRLISEERDSERKLSSQNKIAMEKALDNAQRELVDIRTDRDMKMREAAAVESRFAELRNLVSSLRTELEEKADEIRHLKDRELDLLARERANELTQKEKEAALEEVRNALEAANHQHETQLRERVREGEHNAVSRIESLSMQVMALTEKCHRSNLDLELTRGQHVSLQERYTELRQAHEATCHQLGVITQTRDQVSLSLSDCTAEVSRLVRAANEASCELATVKSQKEILAIQLEERERNFLFLKEQNDRFVSSNDTCMQREASLTRKKDESERRLSEKLAELEEVNTEKQIIVQKIACMEHRTRSLEENEKCMKAELLETKSNLEAAERIKEASVAEIREAKYEVSGLKEHVASLQRLLEQREGCLGLELNHLSQKLRDTERELRLSRKALKVQEETDEKAVEVAGKMQKEVTEKRSHIDALCSKIHWMEDSLDIASKEKKALEETVKRLRNEVDKTTEQREKISLEFRQLLAKCNHLKSQLMQAETEREKVSLEQATAKSQAEQYAQEITRLRFKHQMELKELERTGQVIRSQFAQVPVPVPTVGSDESHASGRPPVITSYDSTVVAISAPVPLTTHSNNTGLNREYPTSIKPPLTRPPQYDNGAVGSELHQLLQEMRSVLQVSQNQASAAVYMPTTNSNHRYNADQEISSLQESINFQSSDHSTSDLHVFSDMEDWSRDLPVRDKRSSTVLPSVFDLMTGTVQSSTTDFRRNFTDSELSVVNVGGASRRTVRSTSTNRKTKQHRGKSQTAPFDPETKAICERLEKKIENLSRLGGNLQKDSRDFERSMKDHGKHLSRVKKQLQK